MTTATNEIGKSIPRQDGVEKVTGEAIFTTGIVRPNMLHAKVLRTGVGQVFGSLNWAHVSR